MECEIHPMLESHYQQVSEIFIQGINGGNATYDSISPNWEDWDRAHLTPCRWVATANQRVIGWAALSPVSARTVFRGVAELSIYIDTDFQGKGIGTQLLKILIPDAEKQGIWTIQSGIFPENNASLLLHQKFGFRIVGTRERIGQMPKTGAWRDIVLLERRSKVL